ncbi:putative nitrate regulatory gene2 protein-like [Cocos nucifera]|nr:putative nitrate regulatory gene2 protein-like [Cocos nucifera]
MEIEEEKIKSPAIPPPPPAVSNDIRHDEPPVTLSENVVAEPLPPKLVKKPKQGGSVHHQHAVSATPSESKRGTMVAATVPPVNMLLVLNELDDHFLKASESAHEVLKMLEATRMHYHSNFANNREFQLELQNQN